MGLYIAGIAVGLFGLFWGFYASQVKRFPVNMVGGIVAVGCLVLTIVSVILLCVPDFFG